MVGPGNPTHRRQARAKTHSACPRNRLVTLATGSPSLSPPSPHPPQNATVMLSLALKPLRGGHHSQNASKAGQSWRHGHGQENPRIHYQPDIIRRWLLDRGSSATHHRSSGNQPAYQSMINRRFMIVPPAMPSSGRATMLERQARNFHACCLKRRT